jgi:hypothetical protein
LKRRSNSPKNKIKPGKERAVAWSGVIPWAVIDLTEMRAMSVDRITLDTNILIYAIDKDAGIRHQRAMGIVDDAVQQDCVLVLQALSEFFSAVTRK